MLQVALARVPHRWRERLLAPGIWHCVLGAAPLARFDDERRALHGLPASPGALRLPHHRCVLHTLFPPRFHTAGGDHTDRGDASGRVVHCWPLWWWPLIVTNVDSCVSILQVRSASLPRIGQSGDYTALFGWTEHDALALRTRRGAPSPLETCSPPIVGAAVRRASGGCRYISSITYEILHHNGNPNTTLGR